MIETTPIYIIAGMSLSVVAMYLYQPYAVARLQCKRIYKKIAETIEEMEGRVSTYDLSVISEIFRGAPTVSPQSKACKMHALDVEAQRGPLKKGTAAASTTLHHTLPGKVEFWVDTQTILNNKKPCTEPTLCFLIETGVPHGNHCILSGDDTSKRDEAGREGALKRQDIFLPSECDVYTDNISDLKNLLAALDELAAELEWLTSRRKVTREEKILPNHNPFKGTIDGVPAKYKIALRSDKILLRLPLKDADAMRDIHVAVRRLMRRMEYLNTKL